MTESTQPTLDLGVLEALRDSVGGDDGFVADLVETYLGDSATQLGAIDNAIANGDAAELVRPAHTLKSASFTVGAMRLGELARGLEQRGRAGQLDGAAVDAGEARVEWNAAAAALRTWLSERAA
jgi:HPt (histidine-containing phosphotransfer) domain-containing protein